MWPSSRVIRNVSGRKVGLRLADWAKQGLIWLLYSGSLATLWCMLLLEKMVGKWFREGLEVSLRCNEWKVSGKFRPRKWFSVRTKHILKYRGITLPPSVKSRQMGLVMPDKKVRTRLGVPAISVPVIATATLKCQQGLNSGSLASVCIDHPAVHTRGREICELALG